MLQYSVFSCEHTIAREDFHNSTQMREKYLWHLIFHIKYCNSGCPMAEKGRGRARG